MLISINLPYPSVSFRPTKSTSACVSFYSLLFLFQTQFIIVTLHSVQLLFIECSYPKLFVYWIGLYAVVFMAMFANFYRQAYKKPKSDSGKVTNDSGKVSNGAVTNGVKHKEH